MTQNKYVGIDLGTTFSAIAHINDFGIPEILPNSEGERITPSVILFEDDEIIIGKIAKQNSVAMPERVVEFVKRQMGKSAGDYSREFRGEYYSAERLSSLIIKKLKEDAEERLGIPITDAVITVPAYFNEAQRASTVEAGKMAGLNVLRIVNEPTAAALAFGIHKAGTEQTILVFDLGGGTFDVTMMRIERKNIIMVATNGDHMLGGKDWDDEIIKYVAEQFETEYGIDPLSDLQAYHDLQLRAVQAKLILTSRPKTPIIFGYKGKSLNLELTEREFRELTSHLVDRCRSLTDIVLDEAGLNAGEVDIVLLTGGSTRMPMVCEMLREFFGKEPDVSVNPDEVVALGAAVQGAMLQITKGLASANVVKMLGGITNTDVNSHSLGIVSLKDGILHNSVIIPKNNPIPCKKSRSDYVTSYDNQSSLDVYLVQGEEEDPQYCSLLGAYEFYDIPPRPAGDTQLDVTFKYNLNGMVEIEAKDVISGKILPKNVKKDEVNLNDLESKITPPQDIALLIDCSGSMYGHKIEDAKKAVCDFVDQIQGLTRVGLISFGDPDAHMRASLSSDFEKIKRTARILTAEGGTPMAEAISLADESLLRSEKALNIMILLTDGMPNDTEETRIMAERTKSRNVRLITIGVGNDVNSEFLRNIASSPEDYHFVSESFELSSTFINIATELSSGLIKKI